MKKSLSLFLFIGSAVCPCTVHANPGDINVVCTVLESRGTSYDKTKLHYNEERKSVVQLTWSGVETHDRFIGTSVADLSIDFSVSSGAIDNGAATAMSAKIIDHRTGASSYSSAMFTRQKGVLMANFVRTNMDLINLNCENTVPALLSKK